MGLLVLPGKLEEFEFAAHARDLLDIDRVLALEPPRWRARRMLTSEIIAIRQARRLRFPGKPKLVVLFHPRQFHLARALSAQHEAELWYLTGAPLNAATDEESDQLQLLDDRARDVAAGLVAAGSTEGVRSDNQPVRSRMAELAIISTRPFVPGARIVAR